MKSKIRASLWVSAAMVALVALGTLAAKRYVLDRPHSSPGWAYEIHTRWLPHADNVAIGPDKSIYVSLERSDGRGRIVRLKDGRTQTVVYDLNRPDGLIVNASDLYVSEEVEGGRILKIALNDFSKSIVARLEKPEGIMAMPNGVLIVAQDKADGRVVKISSNGTITVLADHIRRPEGLTLGKGGEIFVAETATGRILRISEKGVEPFVEGLDQPDQVAMGPDGALWITEDRKGARLMRFISGRLETILENLNAPQGIAIADATSVYVAEQGRNRLLWVHGAK